MRRISGRKKREKLLAFVLLLPVLIVFSVFMFWPLIQTVWLSLYDWNMVSPEKHFVGFANYTAIFQDGSFVQILKNTGLYVLLFLAIDFAVPYLVSCILAFAVKKMTAFYKSALFLPSLLSLVTAALIFSWLFNPIAGPLSKLFALFGQRFPNWAQTNGLVIVVLSIITSWKLFGYNLIVLLAGVSSIPLELIETARLEKTPPLEVFFRIILPLSSSTGIYTLIITIVWGLQWVFTPINILTAGGPDKGSLNIIYEVYDQAFTFFNTGKASAWRLVTLLLFSALLFLEFRYVEKGIYYEN